MYPQRTLIPNVVSLNTQEEEQNEYGNLQRKLQGYKETLKMIQKNNEDDRKNLFSRRSSNQSCYNTDILQLTESQEEESARPSVNNQQHLQIRIGQLEQQIVSLQNELAGNKKQMIQTANLMEQVSSQRDQLFEQVQNLRIELEQQQQLHQQQQQQQQYHQKSFNNNTLLDITYEQENTQDYGRKRIKSLKGCGGKSVVFEDINNKQILQELSELLRCENLVKEVQNIKDQLKKQDKFIGCLKDMVIKLTPKGIYQETKPNLRECWRFIKRILNEYMILKQEESIVDQISEILNVPNDQIISEIQLLIKMLIQKQYS